MPSYVRTLYVKAQTFDFLEDTTFPFFSKPFNFPGKKYKRVHVSGTLACYGWTQIMLSQLIDLKLDLL